MEEPIALPAKPGAEWARHSRQAVMPPSQARLDAEHQLVTVRNTDPRQTHIVVDRFQIGHPLLAGQAKELDMLKTDIEFFVGERDPSRKDFLGQPKPLHPVVIEGVKLSDVKAQQPQQQPAQQNRNR